MEKTSTAGSGFAVPLWLAAPLQVVIATLLPLLLVLINARLLMFPPFMVWEYQRPNFPADPYGFTTEDRMEYGPLGLAYLFNSEDIDYLGDLTFENGDPVFNERELSHMHDVKLVTQNLVRVGFAMLGFFLIAAVLLGVSDKTRGHLLRGLLSGSLLTVMLLVAGVGLVIFQFDLLFAQFHSLFFAGDSWIFPTSDTLIRLYPIQFWTDAFAVMFGGALVEAIVIGVVSWRLLVRRSKVSAVS